jgi:KRAB domain-containing zinc finger protein
MFRKNVCLHIFFCTKACILHSTKYTVHTLFCTLWINSRSLKKSFEETGFFNKVKMADKPSAKNFKCEICDYSTQKQADLKRHTNLVHLNMKNFKCTQCSSKFGTNSSLKRHINSTHKKLNAVHLEKKEFKCDICDKAFSQKGSLDRHVNSVHKNLTRYSCDLCDYSSYQRANLEAHSKGVRPSWN